MKPPAYPPLRAVIFDLDGTRVERSRTASSEALPAVLSARASA
jgi:hypothetical protein